MVHAMAWLSRPARFGTYAALALLGMALLTALLDLGHWQGDLHTFYDYGQRMMVQGQVPYRDFSAEYPPLALAAMALPFLAGSVAYPAYVLLLVLENAVLAWVAGAVLVRESDSYAGPGSSVAPWAFVLLVAAASPLVAFKVDLLPVLLTVLALDAVIARRGAAAGAWLGLGTLARLYPLALLPMFGAYLVGQGTRRSAVRLVVAAAVVVGAGALLTAWLAPPGLVSVLDFMGSRGIHLESIAGAVVALGQSLGAPLGMTVAFDFGSYNLHGGPTGWLLPVLTALMIVAFAGASWWGWLRLRPSAAARSTPGPGTLAGLGALALAVILVTSKTLSPQYIFWLAPFVAFVTRRTWLLLAAVLAWSFAMYPIASTGMIALEAGPLAILNLRNLLLVVLTALLVLEVMRRRGGYPVPDPDRT
jgi:Glycosyltransferase family 87